MKMKVVSIVRGVVFAKEDGIAFINLARGKQIWIPAVGWSPASTNRWNHLVAHRHFSSDLRLFFL